jgi:hypothetical protein
MKGAILNRLARLESQTFQRDAMVHVIPAHTDEEFEEKRAAFIQEHGANPGDIFVQVHKFTQEEPFTTGKTMMDLLAHVSMNGRRVYDNGRDSL